MVPAGRGEQNMRQSKNIEMKLLQCAMPEILLSDFGTMFRNIQAGRLVNVDFICFMTLVELVHPQGSYHVSVVLLITTRVVFQNNSRLLKTP
jgi:hypothetical protein